LKQILTIIFLFCCTVLFGQVDSATSIKPTNKDTVSQLTPKKITVKKTFSKVDSSKKSLLTDSSKIKAPVGLDTALVKARIITDSLYKDSLVIVNSKKNIKPKIDTSTYFSILSVPYLPFNKNVEFKLQKDHHANTKNELFYILIVTFMLLGFVKITYPKYFKNMFSMFFKTTLRSKHTREQFLQNKLASLLMNILFIVICGIYVSLVVKLKGWVSVEFWWLIVYTSSILAIIYTTKFLFLNFIGWVFNTKEIAQTYILIVFLSNKIIAVALLPLLLILSFNAEQNTEITYTISIFLIVGILLYRYLISLSSVRKDLNINPLHFFLYLCSVEILPLLIIYKAAFNFIGTSI
jgi:hypothetical protein